MSKQSDAVKKWRKNTKQRIIDSMGGKCQCCGYNQCNEALDIHHIDPSKKELSFGSIRANPIAWPKIVEELKKCILVCRNCHAEIHNADRKIPDNYSTFDESFSTYKVIGNLTDECPVCKTLKPSHNKFCSLVCSGKHSHSKNGTDWSKVDLVNLIEAKSVSQIAEEYGVTIGSITKQLRKRNIPYIRQDGHKRPEKDELISLLPFLSMAQIAKQFNVNEKTVLNWFRFYEINDRPFAN